MAEGHLDIEVDQDFVGDHREYWTDERREVLEAAGDQHRLRPFPSGQVASSDHQNSGEGRAADVERAEAQETHAWEQGET